MQSNLAMVALYLFFPLLIGGFFVLLAGFMIYALTRKDKRSRLLKSVSEKIGGIYEGGRSSFSSFPRVRFHSDGGEGEFTYHTEASLSSEGQINYTDIYICLKKPLPCKITICDEGLLTKAMKTFGMRDFEIGDPDFDKYFYIKVDDEEIAKNILKPELRRLIHHLHLMGRNSFEISIAEKLYIKKLGFVEETDSILQLIEIAENMGKELSSIGKF